MQASFICYKPKFVNLELKTKTYKSLNKTFSKKYKNKIKSINPTQFKTEHIKFYWVRENCWFHWIKIFTSRTC